MKKIFCLILSLALLASAFAAAFADIETEYNEFGFPVRGTYEKDAEYNKGMAARDRKDDDGAFRHFRNSALDGYAYGQYEYANCFENGWGTKKNYSRCFEYYFYAAMQGHDLGQAALGRCYLWGHGVGKDNDQAVYYFGLSADQGCDLGQLWLGYCYQNGIGVEKDKGMARYYYELSAEQGNKNAEKRLKSL